LLALTLKFEVFSEKGIFAVLQHLKFILNVDLHGQNTEGKLVQKYCCAVMFSRLNLHGLKQNGLRLSVYHHSNTWKRKRQKSCGKLWSSSIHRYLGCYLLKTYDHQAFTCTLTLLYIYPSKELIFKKNRRVDTRTYRLILVS